MAGLLRYARNDVGDRVVRVIIRNDSMRVGNLESQNFIRKLASEGDHSKLWRLIIYTSHHPRQ